jgi:outer membrane protein assembly factor BamB
MRSMNSRPYVCRFLILAVLCLIAGLSACGALTEKGRLSPADTNTAPDATAPANLTVQQPLLSAPGGFGLAAPVALHARLDALRQSSYVYEDLSKRGDEYEYALPSQRITSSLGRLNLAPDWTSASDSSFSGLAYALYSFKLESYDLSGAVCAQWQVPPAASGLAWIGFGNVALNRWEWFALDSENIVLTPGFSDYIASASQRMLVAVVLLGTQPAVLGNLRLGSGISGQILDTSGAPVGGAQVQIAGLHAVQADYKGEFSIWGLAAADPLVVNFTAEGYMDNTRVYQVVDGRQRFERIVMLPRSSSVAVDCATGGELLFPGPLGGSLTLPPGALLDHNSDPLMGNTQAYLTYLDVTDPAQLAAAPGDFTAVQLDSTDALLESFGMCEIYIADTLGGEAQLAVGQTAQLKLPIPASQQATAPATMGLYSFDEALCKWIEEGVLTKDGTGQFYEGALSHFSTWNADREEDRTCVRVHVVDSQNRDVAGAVVILTGVGFASASSGFTRVDGYACLDVQHASDAIVYAYHLGASSEVATVSTPPSVMECGSTPNACLYIKKLTLREPPAARLAATPATGASPLTVDFDASASTEGDAALSNYEWDFDGQVGGYVWQSSGALATNSHTYETPGDYYATVRVTDANGLSSMAVLWIKVGGASARGDWWMSGHDPQRTFYSNFMGPLTNHLAWTGDATDDSVIDAGIALAADGTIYLGDISYYVYAFDPLDGSIKWKSAAMGERTQCTPAIAHDGTIFTVSYNSDNKLYAFDPDTGAIAWTFNLLGGRESPVIGADNTVYCGYGQTYGINPTDHTRRWFQGSVLINKCFAQSWDGTLYGPQQDGRLAALNPGTGECIWESLDVGDLDTPPAVGRDGTIYICGSDSTGGALFAFYPGRGDLKWTANTNGDRVWGQGPAIGLGGRIYVCDVYYGVVYAFNPDDGARLWTSDHSADIPGPYYYSCNPAIGADGTLYLGASDAKIHALDPMSGGDKWVSAALDATVTSTPAIAPDGTLYVVTENGTLYAFRDP